MRGKLVVESVTNYASGNTLVNLVPIMDETEENEDFWPATPSGKLEMCITNPNTRGFFEAGAKYYINLTRATEDSLSD